MIDVGVKWGNEGDGMSLEIGDVREQTKEVAFNKFFRGDPKLLTMVVDNLVLVWVSVDGKGAGRGMEKIGEEVSYRYL